MKNAQSKQIETLNFSLIEMGALVERAVACAAKGFIAKDIENAKNAFLLDGEIAAKEKEIESLSMKLLLHSPGTLQLRQISSALKMITDLKRAADQASDISELAILMADDEYTVDMFEIPNMARETVNMMTDSIEAFVHNDIDLALSVKGQDDRVDLLFDTEKEMLIKTVREDAERASQALDFLMIAKYFERIGDHAVSVAEWVIYSITGKHTDKYN